jgi:exodeoxyribonuclease VII large subunit
MSDASPFLAPRECDHPYTISEINEGIAAVIEAGNTLVWIEGEISNWKPSSSGHCYFRLKDAASQIPAVLWRSSVLELQFQPADGMAVTAIASIRVYQRGGYYQLDVHRMQPLGQGALHAAFLKLKARLEREGLFDPSFKKPLPQSISRIGVVTSKNGAAIRDIVRVVSSRAPQTNIVLCDVAVQGDAAAGQIAEALAALNVYGNVDCIIVGRGGGSMEDLQAFNEEIVARAIFASKIPVISAVGHEIDFTIADFVADVRAATPSAAAQLVAIDSEDAQRLFSVIADRFSSVFSRYLSTTAQYYRGLKRHSAFRKPWRLFLESQQQADEVQHRFQRAILHTLEERTVRLATAAKQLSALSPLAVLSRGYSVVSKDDGTVVHSAKQVAAGERVNLRFSQGKASGVIEEVSCDGTCI